MTPISHYGNYSRVAPVLPDPDSLPYPANLIVKCSDCGLRSGCTRPVPADNTQPCGVLLVGEAPGRNEDEQGKPFVGMAGQYLDSLLFQSGLPRESVCITNVCHCRPPNNRTPKPDEVRSCSKWLELELDIVQPRIVVALGKPATDWFLPGNGNTMEHLHGKPVEKDGRIILPCYHPAFALRDTSKMRQVSEDFQVLRGLVKGRDWREYHVTDEYPNPKYIVVDTPDKVKMMEYLIEQAGEFAVDTEICRGKLWSVQISCKEGEAYFIPVKDDYEGKVDLSHLKATAIVHNYLFDIQYLKLDEANFVDTMTMAYLTGAGSQGLKELASRLCGVQMVTYREIVSSGQQDLSLEYLLRASGMDWPDPPTIEETKWDNKKGCLATKTKKPWHISRKINKMLGDYSENGSTDLWDRWRNIPDEERSVVEGVIGAMPESSLADIDFSKAVAYACRDSDATLRVHHKLKKMITELDLDFVLDMDLGILPIVNSMMQNGMPVDLDHFRKLSEDYDVRMRVMSEEMAGVVGHPFNPNSSDQVAEVVYKELGFKPTKMTPTGKVSTDDAELKKTGHPVAKDIIRYRGIQKLKSTYADSLIEWARPDEQGIPRVHTTLKTTRVETGRLASADPNLQNIPTRNKESKQIKNGFIAPAGKRMGEMDYCLVPGTHVLTDDWRWVPIESLKAGDTLVGITENSNGQGRPRTYTPTAVVRTGSRKLPCYQVFLGDGTILTCSGEHPWLARGVKDNRKVKRQCRGTHSFTWNWFTTSNLRQGHVLARMVRPWRVDDSWEGGFIAGAFDGEGSLASCRGNILTFTQSLNGMLVKVSDILEKKGFQLHDWHEHKSGFGGRNSVIQTWICDSTEIVRFLGTFRPPRLLDKSTGMLWGKQPNTEMVEVLKVVPIGEQDVISLETTSHTFVAEGFFTHNSQIEMVTLAHLSNCKRLVELFNRGGDPHTEMAAEVFGLPKPKYEEGVADVAAENKYRYPVKRLNFGIAYLIGGHGLSTQLQEYVADLEMEGEPVDIEPWDEATCEKFIAEWYKLNSEVKDYQLERAAEARRYGYVRDPLSGRIRYIPEINCPIVSVAEGGARMAANFPVTCSAQTIIKTAMRQLWQELPGTPWANDVEWAMQIHDSLITFVTDDDDIAIPFFEWMLSVMTGVYKLRVPIKADLKSGYRWAEMEKIKL